MELKCSYVNFVKDCVFLEMTLLMICICLNLRNDFGKIWCPKSCHHTKNAILKDYDAKEKQQIE
jgi:hypothetical protein